MHRFLLASAVLLLAGCGLASSDSVKPQSTQTISSPSNEITGIVTKIERRRVTVGRTVFLGSLTINDFFYGIDVGESTRILEDKAGEISQAQFESLNMGDKVKISVNPGFRPTYPPSGAFATEIVTIR